MTEATETKPFPHPETGEALASETDFRGALDELTERMAPLWRVRNLIREEWASRFPTAAMPSRRRDRTDTQERVYLCPRCGLAKVLNEEGPK